MKSILSIIEQITSDKIGKREPIHATKKEIWSVLFDEMESELNRLIQSGEIKEIDIVNSKAYLKNDID